MLMALLIVILSSPGETPVIFGVLDEFDSPAKCLKAIRDMDVPDEKRRNLACIEVKKQTI